MTISLLLISIAIILQEEIVAIPGFPFALMGIVFIIRGFAITDKVNYEKIRNRQRKYGYIDTYEVSAKIITLEEKCRILEERIRNLENDLKRLR